MNQRSKFFSYFFLLLVYSLLDVCCNKLTFIVPKLALLHTKHCEKKQQPKYLKHTIITNTFTNKHIVDIIQIIIASNDLN